MDVTYTGIRGRQEEGLVLSREISTVKGAGVADLEMLGKSNEG